MATIIDALLVTLSLDIAGFKKGQGEADEALKKTKETTVKNAKDIEAKAKVAADSFKGMRREILGLLTAFAGVGAIKNFVQGVVTGDAALGRLAETVGMSTEKLSALRDLAEKFGGSAGDIDAALRHIFTLKENYNRGAPDTGVMSILGQLLNPDDVAKFYHQATTTAQAYEILQRAVVNNSDKAKSMNLMQNAGFTEGTVVVMREIGSNFDSLVEAQIKLNKITKDNTEQAKKLAAAWQDVVKAIESVGRTILNSPLLGITEALTKAAATLKKWKEDPSTIVGDIWSAPEKLDTVGGAKKALGWLDDGIAAMVRQWMKDNPNPSAARPSGAASSPAANSRANAWTGASETQEAEADLRGWAWAQASRQKKKPVAAASLLNGGAQRSSAAAASKTDVSIGTLTVNTQATDAPGIARDIGSAIRENFSLTGQLNFGTE
jgi:hypothetical protein